MYWQESNRRETIVVRDDVTDVVYQIACRTLPVDHAWALSQAVQLLLPWIGTEPVAGIHTIHVADSGNGWMRPEHADDLLYLSRRTKLVLRVPRHRVDEAQSLVGNTLDVAGHAMKIEGATQRALSPISTIFSRYVVSDEQGEDENAFLARVLDELRALGVEPKKMLCGIEKVLATPERPIRTRSLMIAELTPPESVTVQQRGLGALRQLGCGLFLPHKDIKELKQALD
jgi:CRISPR-associated protein Cas6